VAVDTSSARCFFRKKKLCCLFILFPLIIEMVCPVLG
jgi:hypothetical protein